MKSKLKIFVIILLLVMILFSLSSRSNIDPEIKDKLDKIKFAYTNPEDRSKDYLYSMKEGITGSEIDEKNIVLARSWLTFSGETEAINLWKNCIFTKYGKINDEYALFMGYFDLTDITITFHYKYKDKYYKEDYEYYFKDNCYNSMIPILCLKDENGVKEFNPLPNYSYDEKLEYLIWGYL